MPQPSARLLLASLALLSLSATWATADEDSHFGCSALIEKLVLQADEDAAESLLEIWQQGDPSTYTPAGKGMLLLARRFAAEQQNALAARMARPLLNSSLPKTIRDEAREIVLQRATKTQRQNWQAHIPEFRDTNQPTPDAETSSVSKPAPQSELNLQLNSTLKSTPKSTPNTDGSNPPASRSIPR